MGFTIVRVAKERCIARRWPTGRPVNGKPMQMAASKPISADEHSGSFTDEAASFAAPPSSFEVSFKVTAPLTLNIWNDRPSVRLLGSSATPVLDWI